MGNDEDSEQPLSDSYVEVESETQSGAQSKTEDQDWIDVAETDAVESSNPYTEGELVLVSWSAKQQAKLAREKEKLAKDKENESSYLRGSFSELCRTASNQTKK